jgi:hypothetical protein
MRGQPGHPLCSRNARSRTPLVGRAHYGDQPGYTRREAEKEKTRIGNSVRAFDSQDSVGRREVRVPLEAALERNCAKTITLVYAAERASLVWTAAGLQ